MLIENKFHKLSQYHLDLDAITFDSSVGCIVIDDQSYKIVLNDRDIMQILKLIPKEWLKIKST